MLFQSDGKILENYVNKLCEIHYLTTGHHLWFISDDGFKVLSSVPMVEPYEDYLCSQVKSVMHSFHQYDEKIQIQNLLHHEKVFLSPVYYRKNLKGLLVLGPFKSSINLLQSPIQDKDNALSILNYIEQLPVIHTYQYQSFMFSLKLYCQSTISLSNPISNDLVYEKSKAQTITKGLPSAKIRHHKLKDEAQLLESLLLNDGAIDLKLFSRFDDFLFPPLANEPVRSEKNRIIGANALLCREAIRLGADSESAFNLSDQLIVNIEMLESTMEIMAYYMNVLVPSYSQIVPRNRSQQLLHPVIKQIIIELNQTYVNPPTIQELSKKHNLSLHYLSKLFSSEMGCHYKSYVSNLKISKAKSLLLETNASIIQIAEALGYNYANYFSRVFKEEVGVTPLEYRRQNQ